jgi:hypothetical protein
LNGSYEQQENLEYEPIIDEHKDEVNRERIEGVEIPSNYERESFDKSSKIW